jgi:hypothetical protein
MYWPDSRIAKASIIASIANLPAVFPTRKLGVV